MKRLLNPIKRIVLTAAFTTVSSLTAIRQQPFLVRQKLRLGTALLTLGAVTSACGGNASHADSDAALPPESRTTEVPSPKAGTDDVAAPRPESESDNEAEPVMCYSAAQVPSPLDIKK